MSSHESSNPSVARRVNLTLSPEVYSAIKSFAQENGEVDRVTTAIHRAAMLHLGMAIRSATHETLAKVRAKMVAHGVDASRADELFGAFRDCEVQEKKTEKKQETKSPVHSPVPGKPVSSEPWVPTGFFQPFKAKPVISKLGKARTSLKSSPVIVNRKPSALHPLGYPVKSLSKVHQMFIGAAFAMGNQNQDGLEYGSAPVEDDRPVPLPSALPSSSSPDLNTINLNTLTRPRTCTRVDIDNDSSNSNSNARNDRAGLDAESNSNVTPMQSAITRRSTRKAEQTVAPCAARAAKKQVPLIPVQLTSRAQECLDEMRRLGGPFEEMDPDSLDSIAAESDKLLRPTKDLVCTAKAYYVWWTTAPASKRHKDTRRGWLRWVQTADSGIYDRKPFTPQTWEQRRAEGAERVRMFYRIKERMDCKKINDLRRAAGEPIKEGFDDWDPEVAGLKLEDYA